MYTRSGSYAAVAASPVGWELVHQQAGFEGLGIAKIKMLDQLRVPVLIKAGSIQAFRIVANRRILLGRPTFASQTEVASTAALSLRSGKMSVEEGSFVPTSLTSHFIWNGILEYCQPSGIIQKSAELSSNLNKPCVLTTFNSIYFGISSVYGE